MISERFQAFCSEDKVTASCVLLDTLVFLASKFCFILQTVNWLQNIKRAIYTSVKMPLNKQRDDTN